LIDAIDRAVAETGVARYRYLALEHPDLAVRRRYADWILAGRPAQAVAPPSVRVDYDPATPSHPCGGCP